MNKSEIEEIRDSDFWQEIFARQEKGIIYITSQKRQKILSHVVKY